MNTREFAILWILVDKPQFFTGMEKAAMDYLYRNETLFFGSNSVIDGTTYQAVKKQGRNAPCGTTEIQQMMHDTPVTHAPYFDRTEVTLGEILSGDKSPRVRPPVWSIHIAPYVKTGRGKSAKRGKRGRSEPFWRFNRNFEEPDEELDDIRDLSFSRHFHERQYPDMTPEEKKKRIDFPEEIARRAGLPTNPPTKRRAAAVQEIFDDPYLTHEQKLEMADVAASKPTGSVWTDSYSQKKTYVKKKDWVEETF